MRKYDFSYSNGIKNIFLFLLSVFGNCVARGFSVKELLIGLYTYFKGKLRLIEKK